MARSARFGPSTPGQWTLSASDASTSTASARSIAANSEQSGWSPSSRGGATWSSRLTFAGAISRIVI
jgi:hypothetical protein